jgi:hypothetical protein
MAQETGWETDSPCVYGDTGIVGGVLTKAHRGRKFCLPIHCRMQASFSPF